jgi:hypothetical protein
MSCKVVIILLCLDKINWFWKMRGQGILKGKRSVGTWKGYVELKSNEQKASAPPFRDNTIPTSIISVIIRLQKLQERFKV